MADEDNRITNAAAATDIVIVVHYVEWHATTRRTASRVRISQPPRKSQPNPSGPTPPPSFITVIYTFIISFAPHRSQPLAKSLV